MVAVTLVFLVTGLAGTAGLYLVWNRPCTDEKEDTIVNSAAVRSP